MVCDLKLVKVFIASPGGLQEERKSFREELAAYNEVEAIPRGYYFQPVGWEDTLGGVGRPQEIINRDVAACDCFVMVLWDRWGSRTDAVGGFSSGTEEELSVALRCLGDAARPMAQVLVLFKAVDPKQLSDAGPELRKVLDFRQGIESNKQHLYQTFDTSTRFQHIVRSHLGRWLRALEEGSFSVQVAPEQADEQEIAPHPPIQEAVAATTRAAIVEAWKLADEGRAAEAEVAFARLTVDRREPGSLVAYASFLGRLGRHDQARALLEEAVAAAHEQGNVGAHADATRLLASAFEWQGDYLRAEEMVTASIGEYAAAGRRTGEAIGLRHLARLRCTRGDFVGAKSAYARSLEISKELGDRDGEAAVTGGLATILHSEGDLVGAEKLLRGAIEYWEKRGKPEAVAVAVGNLGSVLMEKGDLDGAEAMHRRSRDLNTKLGKQAGVADAIGNLAIVLQQKGDLRGAEEMYRESIKLEEQLGRAHGKAHDLANLAILQSDAGRLDEAEETLHEAIPMVERLGMKEGLANCYSTLGIVMKRRGKLDAARQYLSKSLEIEEAMGRRGGVASDCINLGNILVDESKVPDALSYFQRACDLLRTDGEGSRLVTALISTASAYVALKNEPAARDALREAGDVATRIGDRSLRERVEAANQILFSHEQ